MKKKTIYSALGKRAAPGDMTIYRLLPNAVKKMVGSFFLLDYAFPVFHDEHEPVKRAAAGARPKRGIATLSYILQGEEEHYDSAGNYGRIQSGGIQWMKAGNGIIHDGVMNPDSDTGSRLTQGFQLWINLPAEHKKDLPQYLSIQGPEVPKMDLDSNGSWLKVILGAYNGLQSIIPTFSKQWLYHLHLAPGTLFFMGIPKGQESGAVLLESAVEINDVPTINPGIVHFDQDEGTITINNRNAGAADVLLLGGEPYTDPVIAEGPFVMNTTAQIIQAYEDFHLGKYGSIDYSARTCP